MKRISVFFLAVIVVFFWSYAFAQTGAEMGPFLQHINSSVGYERIALKASDYPPIVNKLSDGVINLATSWVEVPKKVVETSKQSNALAAGTVGLGEGVALGIGQVIAGTYDVSTSVISPDQNTSVKAKYKVEKPEEGFKIDILKW